MSPPSTKGKRPKHIPTGKLVKLLNEKRKSFRLNLEMDKVVEERYTKDVSPKKNTRRMIVRNDSSDEEVPISPVTRRSLKNLFEVEQPIDSLEKIVRPPTNDLISPFLASKTATRGSIKRAVEVEISPSNDHAISPTATRKSQRLQIPENPNETIVENLPDTIVENLPDEQELPEEVVAPITQKRTRGPSKMKSIAIDSDGRLEVKFNSKGQPIGATSISLSSFLGALVREIVPVTIKDCRKIPLGMKEVLWKSIQVYILIIIKILFQFMNMKFVEIHLH